MADDVGLILFSGPPAGCWPARYLPAGACLLYTTTHTATSRYVVQAGLELRDYHHTRLAYMLFSGPLLVPVQSTLSSTMLNAVLHHLPTIS